MSLQVDFWHLVGLGITLMGGFWGLAKLLISATSARLDERFERTYTLLAEMRASQKTDSEEIRRIDREFMLLRAELPEKFVMRDDFVRCIGEVRISVDALALRFENVLLRGKHADQ